MRQAAVVIDVQVGEDDACDISRSNAERAQLWTDFLLALETKRHLPSVIGMERSAGFVQVHPLAGVDDDDAFGMLDDPGIGWKPGCPVLIGHDREPAPQPASTALRLRRLDPNGAGPNGVEFHAFTKIARTTSG
jgi:pimeloyl-ACP methyl ester carboxylesterase